MADEFEDVFILASDVVNFTKVVGLERDEARLEDVEGEYTAVRVLLSDISQSTAIEQNFAGHCLQEIKLTEVVRSSQRIVEGARAFLMSFGIIAWVQTGKPNILKTTISMESCRLTAMDT